jgi:hypothetical protein
LQAGPPPPPFPIEPLGRQRRPAGPPPPPAHLRRT